MAKTVLQMWAEAKEAVETITPEQLAGELAAGNTVVLDVRLPAEIERRGRIENSVPVPRQVIEWWADPESPYFRPEGVFGDHGQRFAAVCDGGGNGVFAASTLQDLGYTNVAALEGGFFAWSGAGMSVSN